MSVVSCAPSDHTESPSCDPGQVTIVAGVPGIAGRREDGLPATDTWLSLPQDVAIGPDGVWWIADYNNHLLREVDEDGIARVVVGSGFPSGGDGGPATQEPLDHPTMALVDPHDPNVLWFAATGNHRIGRLDRAAGLVDFPYGTGLPGFQGDGGPAGEAWFWRPSSLAFGDDGTMVVSDRMNQVVRAITAEGTVSTVAGTPGVAGYGGDGGPAVGATLNAPPWTETDPGNRLDVRGSRLVLADTGNHAIREIDLVSGLIDTLAGPEAGLLDPHDVAVGPDGTTYVADTGNHCVRAVTPSGEVHVVAGACGVEGPATDAIDAADARFSAPVGVAVDAEGGVWISDRDNQVIRRWCP
jgi:streptogramin lyase